MRIRLYNAKILTLNHNFNIIDGEVWIKDGEIAYIGDKSSEAPIFDREIDAEQNLLMPSFKNAHTHSAMTFLRSFAEDMPLESWLNDRVFPMENERQTGDCYAFTRLALLEYIQGGITAFMDMYAFEDETVQAAVDMGVRVVLSGPLNNFTGSIKRENELFKKYNSYHPLVSKVLGFHAVYTTDEGILRELAQLARALHAPVYTHCCETVSEVNSCEGLRGVRPMEYLDSLGIWDNGGGIYHGVHLSDKAVDIIKQRGLSVITCPASNLKLASGIAPIYRLYNEGINVGIGTDGAASNNSLDMFKEMFLVSALQKYATSDASAMPAEAVLKMATVGSARAMGLNNCDVLAVGKRADIIMIDLHQPNMLPQNDIVKNLVFSGNKQNVKMTMIDGNIVYMDNRFYIGDNVDNIYTDAERLTAAIKERCGL
jgi:5-methylthioadenosine/S-adenosylhomocysteine deaminase